MKNAILTALVAAIVFSMAGCGSGSADEEALKAKDITNPGEGTRPAGADASGNKQGTATQDAKL